MSAPRWACRLLARLAPPERADEIVGDLEEAHRRRRGRHGRTVAAVLTWLDALEMAWVLLLGRRRRRLADRGRATRWLGASRSLPVSWLDLKLSVRMLLKHPGLSFVAVVGMTVAVTIGATAFGVIRAMTGSPLPLDEGHRIVTIQNATQLGFDQADETHLHALESWRGRVPALAEVGAYRIVTRNLITADGGVAPSRVAEMTASGFRIARVPPRMGRHLVDADERDGAPDVVVIGHGVWQDRFGGAEAVLGRTLQIGAKPHQIVGVMPPGFAFPVDDRVWVPLRLDPADFEPGRAPPLAVFGRLAPGATVGSLSLQLQGVAERTSEALGGASGRITARAFPYTQELVWGPIAWVLYTVQAVVSMILVVVAVNVAVLVYARTVARAAEITVRMALGASRVRIVGQLFAEAFLLSAFAATAGLVLATFALERVERSIRDGPGAPFWWDFGLSAEALVYGLGLAVVASVIIGVAPALGSTGERMRARLQGVGTGLSGPRLGRTWTALIIVQIAAAVALLPVSLSTVTRFVATSAPASALPLQEVLVATLELDRDPTGGAPEELEAAWQERYAALRAELTRRLEARPEVARVGYMGTPPWQDPDVPFEVDGRAVAPLAGTPDALGSASSGHALGRSTVSPEALEAVDVPALAGRLLNRSDAVGPARSVLVNERFVELVLAGGSAVGRRIRFPQRLDPALGSRSELIGAGQPWHTIVGVIPSFPPHSGISKPEAKAYLPLPADAEGPLTMALRVRAADAGRFSDQLRRIVADVDPMLRLADVETLHAMTVRTQADAPLVLAMIVGLALSVLLLAVAGLYALMSFTVARQRREIGIRLALGARPGRVLGAILARSAWRLALGVALGLAFAGMFDRLVGGETLGGREGLLLPAVASLMVLVGVAATWAPARRGLRVEPSEALRAD